MELRDGRNKVQDRTFSLGRSDGSDCSEKQGQQKFGELDVLAKVALMYTWVAVGYAYGEWLLLLKSREVESDWLVTCADWLVWCISTSDVEGVSGGGGMIIDLIAFKGDEMLVSRSAGRFT